MFLYNLMSFQKNISRLYCLLFSIVIIVKVNYFFEQHYTFFISYPEAEYYLEYLYV